MTAKADRHKVIIVGGGPAGLSTALHLLQQAPHLADDLLVIEAQQHPRPKLCGGALTFHGEEQLAALGLTLADVPAFVAHRMEFRLGNSAFTVPYQNAMRIFDRAVFDAALAAAARQQGVCIHSNERVQAVQVAADGVSVHTDYGRYQADVLVAADGAKSTVRRKLGMQHTSHVARLLRIMTPLDPANDPAWRDHNVIFDFSPVQRGIHGYIWHFPCYYNGQPTMNRGIFDSRLLQNHNKHHNGHNSHKPTLKQALDDDLQQRQVDRQDVPLEGHPVRWFDPNAEFARPRVLLIGDAAGVDPLFAEGISYAMEYGQIATQMMTEAFASGDFAFSGYRERLLSHRLGKLLHRRTTIARALYRQDFPALWSLLFRLAHYSPRRVQVMIGAAMAVLPPK